MIFRRNSQCLDRLRVGAQLRLIRHLTGHTVANVTLGIMTLGGFHGFMRYRGRTCHRLLNNRLDRCRFFGNGLLNNRLFNDLFFNNRFLYRHFLYNRLLRLFGLLIIKFPSKVRIYGNHAAILLGKLRYVIGIQLKGHSGLFLAQIFANQAAADQILCGIERILLLIVHRLNIDRRESLLLASALHQLQCQRQLSGRVHLVKERCFRILLLIADVTTVIYTILQRRGIKRKIQIQSTRTNVDLRNLRMIVIVIIDGPRNTVLSTLIRKKRILDRAVILLNVATRLNQLCLKALAVMCHDVAACLLVKANNTLTAGEEVALVLILTVLVTALLLISLLGFNLVLFLLGIDFLDLLILFLCIDSRRSVFVLLKGGIFHCHLLTGADLRADLHQFRNCLENFLGRGAVTILRLCSRRCGGRGGLLDHLFIGFGNILFNVRHLTAGICRTVNRNTANHRSGRSRRRHHTGLHSHGRLCNHSNVLLCNLRCILMCNSLLIGRLILIRNLFLCIGGKHLRKRLLCRDISLLCLFLRFIGLIILCHSICGFLCYSGSFCLAFLRGFRGNQCIAFSKIYNQSHSKHQRTERGSCRDDKERQLRRKRNRTE